MPTPFTDGEVDRAAIEGNVRRWIAAGLGGVVALGTNGEAPLLDDDECDAIVETARQEVPADRTLIAGVGRESTRATIAAARRAAAAGADAVLVRTPSFYRAQVPVAALSACTAVADADRAGAPSPLAAFTGVNMAPEVIGRLAAHPNIVGLKETSTDGAQFAELAAAVPARFSVLAGSAPGAYTAFCAGAAAAILAVACVRPALCLRLRALVLEGKHAEALVLQQRLTPLARAVTSRFGIAGLKAAMDLCDLEGGDPRLPLGPLPDGALETIRALLNDLAD